MNNNYYISIMKQLKQLIKNMTKFKFQLKKKTHFLDLFILFFGLLGYYFEYYLLTFYTIVHFSVIFLQYLSKDFNRRLENFKKDQTTIKNHYLADFRTFYYLVFMIRLITFLFYFYFFSLDIDNMNSVAHLFYGITYMFVLIGLIDLGITLYIIFYKNHPVIETVANVCYHCVTKGVPMLGALHISSNVPFIAPNPVSNCYHRYSPLGRGYGAWSTGQLVQIDYMKTRLGGEFNYKEIIDQNNMVDPAKLKNYANKHGIDSNYLLNLAATKPKNI
jgi:hypothetical protein